MSKKRKNKKKKFKDTITTEEQLQTRRNLITLEMIKNTKPKKFGSKKDYKRNNIISLDDWKIVFYF